MQRQLVPGSGAQCNDGTSVCVMLCSPLVRVPPSVSLTMLLVLVFLPFWYFLWRIWMFMEVPDIHKEGISTSRFLSFMKRPMGTRKSGHAHTFSAAPMPPVHETIHTGRTRPPVNVTACGRDLKFSMPARLCWLLVYRKQQSSSKGIPLQSDPFQFLFCYMHSLLSKSHSIIWQH